MKFEARLGLHGLTLRVDDLDAAERVFRETLGLSVLRRTRREVTLGEGPELFVTLRPGAGARPPVLEEIHVAVRGLETRAGEPDAFGGFSVTRRVSGSTLCVREFRSEPAPLWRPTKPRNARKPKKRSRRRRRRARRDDTARRRSSRRDST
ncbi:MAG TPA: hypothetical protein VFA98_15895 [Thermoanaerobaculia bacterium]|nr:hypothetical protein [Thermoanaerobaculia bacterium]